MKYDCFGDTDVVRLDLGEDINQSLLLLAKEENITAASITGIGAVDSAVLGVYDVASGAYTDIRYDEFMELTSLVGNLSLKDGEPYLHLHANFARHDGSVVGGHLKSAVIGATAEIFVNCYWANLNRVFQPETGLNILDI